MEQIICIGSSSKDIFFPVEDGVILDTPEDITAQQKLAFELGAKFQADEIFEAPGGCAANVAQGLARLGVRVSCYTKIGADQTGKWIKKELKKEGVKIGLLQVDKRCQSDLSAIIVDKNSGKHLIFFNRDANKNLEVDTGKLAKAKNIFVSALNGDWQKHFDEIMKVSLEKGVEIIFNPGQRNIRDDVDKIIEMIGHSKILILNKDEAIGILEKKVSADDIGDEKILLKELRQMGSEIVVLTDGENGAWILSEEIVYHAVPDIEKKEIVDTLGAGDSFSSGFLAGILKGQTVEEALRWGMANSLEVVKYYGAKAGLLNIKQIDDKAKKISVQKL